MADAVGTSAQMRTAPGLGGSYVASDTLDRHSPRNPVTNSHGPDRGAGPSRVPVPHDDHRLLDPRRPLPEGRWIPVPVGGRNASRAVKVLVLLTAALVAAQTPPWVWGPVVAVASALVVKMWRVRRSAPRCGVLLLEDGVVMVIPGGPHRYPWTAIRGVESRRKGPPSALVLGGGHDRGAIPVWAPAGVLRTAWERARA